MSYTGRLKKAGILDRRRLHLLDNGADNVPFGGDVGVFSRAFRNIHQLIPGRHFFPGAGDGALEQSCRL